MNTVESKLQDMIQNLVNSTVTSLADLKVDKVNQCMSSMDVSGYRYDVFHDPKSDATIANIVSTAVDPKTGTRTGAFITFQNKPKCVHYITYNVNKDIWGVPAQNVNLAKPVDIVAEAPVPLEIPLYKKTEIVEVLTEKEPKKKKHRHHRKEKKRHVEPYCATCAGNHDAYY